MARPRPRRRCIVNRPVDVLAVLDEAIAQHEYHFGIGTCHGKSMRTVRAAVAELIEAGRDVDQTERNYWGSVSRNPERLAKRHEDALTRLRAALARVGGAK